MGERVTQKKGNERFAQIHKMVRGIAYRLHGKYISSRMRSRPGIDTG